jgi:iron(III) transport system permease protein
MRDLSNRLLLFPMYHARRRFPWLTFAAGLIAALIAVPIASVAWSVFQPGQGNWPHLVDTVLPGYIANSLVLMVGVAVGVTITGVGLAWLVVMCRFPGQRFFEWALILPLAMPAYVVAYAYTDFLQAAGPLQTWLRDLTGWGVRDYWFPEIRSIGGAIMVFTAVLMPYVYLLSRTAFLEQSVSAFEASRTLGRTPWSSFVSVAVPMARPAIVGGVALALMETLADFGTVAHFGINTFTTGIYRTWASMGDRVAAAQLSSILFAFVFALLLIEQYSRYQARFHQARGGFQQIRRFTLTGRKAAAATFFCAVPLVLGFIGPFLILLWMALTAGHDLLSPRYVTLTLNSLTLASVTAFLAVVLAVVLSYAARAEKSRLTAAINRVAGMGYAIPGSIIAVGILIPLAALDNIVSAWMEANFGIRTGLLLTGSIAALVFAYLVRFMAAALHSVQASLEKITPQMDDTARSLGHGPLSTGLRIHVPILTGGMLTAALIVFVDVMKELPATLIMRPFNFDTLAVQAYNLAKDERLAQAATPSLVIVACGLLPILVMSRAIMKSRPGSARRKRVVVEAAVPPG